MAKNGSMFITVNGPIVEASRRDPALMEVMNEGMELMGLVAEGMVKEQLYKGHGLVTGHLRRSIGGELKKDLFFQVDAGQVRQGRQVEYASKIEDRYGMFENAAHKMTGEDHQKYFAMAVKRHLGGS